MSEDDVTAEPRRVESTATILARMEGKLDLANYKLTDVGSRVQAAEGRLTDHDTELEKVRLEQQQIRSDLKAHIDTEVAAVKAVREAKDEEVRVAERHWSPAARWATGLSTAAFVAEALYQIFHR